jgi:hypothetical protein
LQLVQFGQLDDPAKLSPAELKKRHELEARERRNRSIWIEPGAVRVQALLEDDGS